MKQYTQPLWIFIAGNIVLLGIYLFLGTIGDAADTLSTDTAAIAGSFWNFTWVSSENVVKFLVMVAGEGLVLWRVTKSFLKTR